MHAAMRSFASLTLSAIFTFLPKLTIIAAERFFASHKVTLPVRVLKVTTSFPCVPVPAGGEMIISPRIDSIVLTSDHSPSSSFKVLQFFDIGNNAFSIGCAEVADRIVNYFTSFIKVLRIGNRLLVVRPIAY